jgi:hypothetical protein
MSAQAQKRNAQASGDHRCTQRPESKSKPKTRSGREKGNGIGANRVEAGVPERNLPTVSIEQIHRCGEHNRNAYRNHDLKNEVRYREER